MARAIAARRRRAPAADHLALDATPGDDPGSAVARTPGPLPGRRRLSAEAASRHATADARRRAGPAPPSTATPPPRPTTPTDRCWPATSPAPPTRPAAGRRGQRHRTCDARTAGAVAGPRLARPRDRRRQGLPAAELASLVRRPTASGLLTQSACSPRSPRSPPTCWPSPDRAAPQPPRRPGGRVAGRRRRLPSAAQDRLQREDPKPARQSELDHLARLARRQRDRGQLVEIYKSAAQSARDRRAATALLCAAGALELARGKPVEAEELFVQASRQAPHDPAAKGALAEIYRKSERWRAVGVLGDLP
jgi:hypothetical protein